MFAALRARRAPAGAPPTALAYVARYQLACLLLAWGVATARWPEATEGLLVGGLLVAMNLQLSRAMVPLVATLRARAASPRQQLTWVALASLGKLLLQLAVAAWVLITWPPATGPFLAGMATFLGGALGGALHTSLSGQRSAAAAAGRGVG